MPASKILPFQITIIGVLLAALTIELSVEHPEWSPDGLMELKTMPPAQIDQRIRLLAVPE